MTLPQLTTPEFTAVIPSTKQKISFRPFLVKEEKILLMALEGNDKTEMIKAVINILDSCILTEVKTDLAIFDVEYLFLKIRGKSVGEIVELKIRHTDDNECKHLTEVSINLDEVEIKGEIKSGKIMLDDNLGIKLRYPNITDAMQYAGQEENIDTVLSMIVDCTEYLYDQYNVYSEFTKDELREWLGQLSQDQFVQISEFFKEVPRLSHDVSWKCDKCGKEDSITIEGLQNFFA